MDADDMKKRLKEMEEEVATLHEMQGKVESHMDSTQGFLFCFFGFNFTMSKIMIFIPLIKFLLKLITNIENVKD